MAALGVLNPIAWIVQRRPLKKRLVRWVQFQYSIFQRKTKILFIGKANTKNHKKCRTSFCPAARRALARRAARKMKRKINGRRFAPPTKWLQKCQKVRFWCIYMTPLELILSKIPEKSNARRLRRRAGNPSARGQKISSPKTPPFFARSPDGLLRKNLIP